MSISSETQRIIAAKTKLRNKTVALGITDSSAKIDEIATAVDAIVDKGTVNANVKEGESYTITPGYYHGGAVNGVGGGGSYTLQEKTITPTKSEQAVSSDEGYYGLSQVTVTAIPASYQDTSSVTAEVADVILGKVIVGADGVAKVGTMSVNSATKQDIDGLTTTSYTIPKGYHDGTGVVALTNDIESTLAEI